MKRYPVINDIDEKSAIQVHNLDAFAIELPIGSENNGSPLLLDWSLKLATECRWNDKLEDLLT